MNNKHLLIFSIFFLGVFGLAGDSNANVTLPWSTTHNCSPYIFNTGDNLGCDNISGWGATADYEGHYHELTADANYPGGGGGLGMRQWIGTNWEYSMGPAIFFTTPVDEVWVRWYMRIPAGMSHTGYHKIIYFWSGTNPAPDGIEDNNICLDFGRDINGIDISQVAGTGLQVWNSANDLTSFWGVPSDGSWHSIEVHIKGETVTSLPFNGVLDLWIDGVNQLHVTNADHFLYSYGDHILGFRLGHNISHEDGVAEYLREWAFDFDDIAIQSTTPAKTDGQGRPMIGPLGWGSSDTTPPAAPSGLNVN